MSALDHDEDGDVDLDDAKAAAEDTSLGVSKFFDRPWAAPLCCVIFALAPFVAIAIYLSKLL